MVKKVKPNITIGSKLWTLIMLAGEKEAFKRGYIDASEKKDCNLGVYYAGYYYCGYFMYSHPVRLKILHKIKTIRRIKFIL